MTDMKPMTYIFEDRYPNNLPLPEYLFFLNKLNNENIPISQHTSLLWAAAHNDMISIYKKKKTLMRFLTSSVEGKRDFRGEGKVFDVFLIWCFMKNQLTKLIQSQKCRYPLIKNELIAPEGESVHTFIDIWLVDDNATWLVLMVSEFVLNILITRIISL